MSGTCKRLSEDELQKESDNKRNKVVGSTALTLSAVGLNTTSHQSSSSSSSSGVAPSNSESVMHADGTYDISKLISINISELIARRPEVVVVNKIWLDKLCIPLLFPLAPGSKRTAKELIEESFVNFSIPFPVCSPQAAENVKVTWCETSLISMVLALSHTILEFSSSKFSFRKGYSETVGKIERSIQLMDPASNNVIINRAVLGLLFKLVCNFRDVGHCIQTIRSFYNAQMPTVPENVRHYVNATVCALAFFIRTSIDMQAKVNKELIPSQSSSSTVSSSLSNEEKSIAKAELIRGAIEAVENEIRLDEAKSNHSSSRQDFSDQRSNRISSSSSSTESIRNEETSRPLSPLGQSVVVKSVFQVPQPIPPANERIQPCSFNWQDLSDTQRLSKRS